MLHLSVGNTVWVCSTAHLSRLPCPGLAWVSRNMWYSWPLSALQFYNGYNEPLGLVWNLCQCKHWTKVKQDRMALFQAIAIGDSDQHEVWTELNSLLKTKQSRKWSGFQGGGEEEILLCECLLNKLSLHSQPSLHFLTGGSFTAGSKAPLPLCRNQAQTLPQKLGLGPYLSRRSHFKGMLPGPSERHSWLLKQVRGFKKDVHLKSTEKGFTMTSFLSKCSKKREAWV